jgi:hypothetical protein
MKDEKVLTLQDKWDIDSDAGIGIQEPTESPKKPVQDKEDEEKPRGTA